MKIYETTGDVYTRQGKASAENELVYGMVSIINYKSIHTITRFLGNG